ncbi:hypothetical protein WBJ53_26110 [Spirosoma sp. SC4-14]|uniref:hypothetical protein n=1 Tax=Spirosoma sp. SC4-14 TaxID=3128900 RepID=UPI0030D1EF33
MITVRLNGSNIALLYETTKAMPASLYQLAAQYEIMAAELGQNETELDAMLAKVDNYIVAGKPEEAREQLQNYRTARVLALDRFQAGQLDWACHVHSVNDKPITDYSESNLIRLIDEWSALGLTQQLVESTLRDVKKNFELS